MSYKPYHDAADLSRGQKPIPSMNIDGACIRALLNSPQHEHLQNVLKTASSKDFNVYVAACRLTPEDLTLGMRRCVGAELRSKLRKVVLPIAGGRYGDLEPQMMLTDIDEGVREFSPVFDNACSIVVPYCVSFFLTSIKGPLPDDIPDLDALPKTSYADDHHQGAQIVCVLEPEAGKRDDLFVTQAAVDTFAQKFPIRYSCSFCGVAIDGRVKCARCRAARYCGKECQAQHWQAHKASCCVDDVD